MSNTKLCFNSSSKWWCACVYQTHQMITFEPLLSHAFMTSILSRIRCSKQHFSYVSLWKHNNTRKNGKMITIPIPEERWWEKYGLQCAKAEVKRIWCYQEIFRQLVQLVKISACNRNDDAQITACHFSDCVVRHYGLPWIIISYRDSTQKFGHLLLSC